MPDSGNRKEDPDPKISKATASGEDLPTFDGPVQVNTPQKEPPSKKPTKAGNPDKVPAASASESHLDPEAIHTLDSAVALKTPITGASAGSKQPPSALDDATRFGGAAFDGTSTSSSGAGDSPKFIGPYQLVKLLGEGGMGQVWLAEQAVPVKRKVALKLIKGGRYDQSVIQRFESERQSLAIMDHPAIAKVFDAGTTPDGQPFFVMEFVPGAPITQYCDQKRLSTRERLELFIKVCDGVQHAHQKAIIHRDLKPGNVMVTEVDGKAAPHIIDFGIAKATEKQPDSEALVTQVGMLVGTPGYMAPEQTDANAQDIDTRADVYALGVILYELLTGSLPFDMKQWQKQPLHEVLRQIREDDPPRPSTKLTTEAKTATETAGMRQVEPRQLVSLLEGDLDWITMKALEKDRARRYDSPTSLAADITRYLTDEPVLATPPSVSYRANKFVKRHKVAVLAATTVFFMLIALAVSMTVQAVRIARERDRANREAAAAKNVSDFLIGLFNVSDPSQARGNTITAREILDQGADQIETKLTNQPVVQAQLLMTIGTVYESLGLYPQTQKLLEKSLELRRRALGPQHPDTLRTMNELGHILRLEGRLTESEKLLRETLESERRVLGPENPDTLLCMIELSNTLRNQGRLSESETLRADTLAVQRRVLGPEHPDTLASMNNLADTLGEEGRLPEAEQLLREALELRRKILGPDHPETLRTAYNLAAYLGIDNHLEEAEKLQRETLDLRRRVLGDGHPDTLTTMGSLATILQSEARYAEAEKLRRNVLLVQRSVLGPEHPLTLSTMSDLANTLSVEGRYKEADTLLREALEIQNRTLGTDHPDTAGTKYNLACNAALGGHRREALAWLRDAIDHGLSPINTLHMAEDSDLKSLHGEPQFEAMVAAAQKRAARTKNPDSSH
jgi:non-specific serine/threonine protein kinase/serine/threonine-protein kinase